MSEELKAYSLWERFCIYWDGSMPAIMWEIGGLLFFLFALLFIMSHARRVDKREFLDALKTDKDEIAKTTAKAVVYALVKSGVITKNKGK